MPQSDHEALLLQLAVDVNKISKNWDQAVGVVNTGSRRMELRSREAAEAIEKSFGSINASKFQATLAETAKLQDQLSAAQVAGNAQEAKALREQLVLRGQLQKSAVAQLETQLAIARAAGDKAQVAQLTETLALQSHLSRFQSVGLTGSKALHEAEAAVVAIGAAERAAEGANVGKALDKVFDSSKLAVLEEGSTKIRLFGSALEPLGPIGLGAAAAIVAVAAAAEEARKAMAWAADLQHTADKLGTTTTSLQQLDYASVATSIGLQQGREAMAQFNVEIGKFETHTGDKRLVKWADGIKLGRDEVNATIDPIQKLQLVLEKIAALGDAQSRSAAAKAFGLDGLLPIINGGTESIDKFVAKMREARENGSIVDPREIARAAELNEKVEEFAYRIGVDFKKVFVELAPAVEKVAEFLEQCAHALSEFAGQIPAAVRGIQALLDKIPHLHSGTSVSSGIQAAAGDVVSNIVPGAQQLRQLGPAAAAAWRALVQNGQAAQLGDRIKSALADGKSVNLAGSDFDPKLGRQGGGQQLNFDKPKGSDQTLGFNKTAQDAYDSAFKALIAATSAAATGLQRRADLETEAVNADLTKKLDDLGAEQAKILAAKNDANKAAQLALIDQAKAEEQLAAVVRKELIARNLRADLIAQQAQLAQAQSQANAEDLQRDEQHLSALAALVDTLKDRTALERKALDVAQARETELADARVKLAQAALDEAKAHADAAKVIAARVELDAAQSARDALPAAQADQNAAFAKSHEGAVRKYTDGLQDLDKVMQEAAVTAAQDLSNGLADAIVNAKSLGDVASGVFRNLIAQLLSAAIQKDIAKPLLALIPGFAGGTDFAPGGLSLVGENGPELLNLPRGSQVIPANQTLSALQNLSTPQARSTLVVQPLHFHAEGAVLTSELLSQANAHADRQATRAAQFARRAANVDSAQSAYASRLNQ